MQVLTDQLKKKKNKLSYDNKPNKINLNDSKFYHSFVFLKHEKKKFIIA